jgi:hypothetical protein
MTSDGKFTESEGFGIAGPADRAGSIVTDHGRSTIEAAEAKASEIRRQADEDARRTRETAHEVATEALGRIDALGGPLAELVNDLRAQADRLSTPTATERSSGD